MNRRKKHISDIAKKLGKSRRGAANLLGARAPRDYEGGAAFAGPTYMLVQLNDAASELFERRRDAPTYTARVNTYERVETAVTPGREISMISLLDMPFARDQESANWRFTGALVFIDVELHEGLDAIGAESLGDIDGRARVRDAILRIAQTDNPRLFARIASLRVDGGFARGDNVIVSVEVVLVPPPRSLEEILRSLRAPRTFSVKTARVPAGAVSADAEKAAKRSRELARNPIYSAATGSVAETVTREEHEMLIERGAVDGRSLQMIRTFHAEGGVKFSERCDDCRRWIFCGDTEHEGVCTCGQRYRVAFDLAEARHWTQPVGERCMDCGKENRAREWIGHRQVWTNPRAGQAQCSACHSIANGPFTLTMKDGAAFTLDAKRDEEGALFEVFGGRTSVGTVRLLSEVKADCFMKVPTADRYFAEIVTQLRDAGF